MKSTLLLAALTTLTTAEPLRQASEARFWLKVPKNQVPLKGLRVSTGQMGIAHWEKDPELRERFADISFPIRWWKWSETTVEFTPSEDSTVELTLLGPWAADSNQTVYRQEIVWDQITAKGAEILNGGFEDMEQNHPKSWNPPWAPYLAPDEWPLRQSQALEGKHVAATWHNRPLVQSIRVSAGKPVTLTLHAKAATLPDFVPPKRLPANTPAHAACSRMKRGINLGNGWEVPPGQQWGVRFTPEDIDRIASEGFDHVRIPVGWHHHLKRTEQGWTISKALLDELEPVIRRAIEKKLIVLLDWHHFDALTKAPDANLDRFVAGWETIAKHFRSWPPTVFFELLNEPCDRFTTEAAGPIYQKTIVAIRKIDPSRIIVASPGQWGQVGELDRFRLPDNDDRIIVTIHCYEPFQFTHQGAVWVGLQDLKSIRYPGPPETPYQIPPSLKDNSGVIAFVEGYNALPTGANPSSALPVRRTLAAAREWSDTFGRPVHLGEFGAHQAGDDASRAQYLRDVRSTAEQLRIPWTMWEWKAGFGYWDPQSNRARFHAAMFE